MKDLQYRQWLTAKQKPAKDVVQLYRVCYHSHHISWSFGAATVGGLIKNRKR